MINKHTDNLWGLGMLKTSEDTNIFVDFLQTSILQYNSGLWGKRPAIYRFQLGEIAASPNMQLSRTSLGNPERKPLHLPSCDLNSHWLKGFQECASCYSPFISFVTVTIGLTIRCHRECVQAETVSDYSCLKYN